MRVVPCRPGRLRGTCRRVQLRAQWTVGEPFGRSGIRLLPQDTWSVLALFKHAHLPARQPLCQLVAAPCPRHRHFSHCHPQRRTLGNWWRRSDLNAQLPACKAGTLPLSYVPMCVWRVIERPFSVCRGGHCTWAAVSRVSTPVVILREGTAPLTSAGSDPATVAWEACSFIAACHIALFDGGRGIKRPALVESRGKLASLGTRLILRLPGYRRHLRRREQAPCPSFRAVSGLFLLSRVSWSYAPAYGRYALRRYGRDGFRMVCHVAVWWGRPELHRPAGVPVALRPDCVPHVPVSPGRQASTRPTFSPTAARGLRGCGALTGLSSPLGASHPCFPLCQKGENNSGSAA